MTLIAALECWYGSSLNAGPERYADIAAALAEKLEVHPTASSHRVRVQVMRDARLIANLLREGDPPSWVNDTNGRKLVLDLRNLTPADAA